MPKLTNLDSTMRSVMEELKRQTQALMLDIPYELSREKDIVDLALSKLKRVIKDAMPDKDGYAKGLCEEIGALLMGKTQAEMNVGFLEYKKLKEIEKERNAGYNQYRSELLTRLEEE